MPAVLGKIYQGQLPSTVGTLFTVPANTRYLIKALRISNTDNSASRYFTVYDGGTAVSNEILGQMTLQPNEVYVEDPCFIVLEPAGTLHGVADAASAVTLTVYGVTLT